MMHRLLRNILIASALLLPAAAGAQTLPDPIQFIIAPETPSPSALVRIEAQGVGDFLGDATITWSLNGEVSKQGVGERSFTFTTGKLGSVTRVGLRIVSDAQATINRTFVFSPSLVNMVWEADTTLPPLSRAKPLYSAGSSLRVLAFPVVYNGSSRIAASSLSFRWFINDNLVTAASGLGRNILNFAGDQLQAGPTVDVDVYFGNTKVARGEVVIPAVDPGVLLYEHDALRGEVTDVALPTIINLAAKEITLQAEPIYFASSARRGNLLQYSWTLDDAEIVGPLSAQGILTLRQTGSNSGAALVGVAIQNQNTEQFVQSGSAALQLLFGQTQGLLRSLFGL